MWHAPIDGAFVACSPRLLREHRCALGSGSTQHLVEELLPHAGELVKLRSDGYSRGSAGGSGGAMCAFTMSWFTPEGFSRAMMWVPGVPPDTTYSDVVRKQPARNIRVWLSLNRPTFLLIAAACGFLAAILLPLLRLPKHGESSAALAPDTEKA